MLVPKWMAEARSTPAADRIEFVILPGDRGRYKFQIWAERKLLEVTVGGPAELAKCLRSVALMLVPVEMDPSEIVSFPPALDWEG